MKDIALNIKNTDIVVSGIRPTGNIHIGNYNAVIKNWLKLQKIAQCFFFIADLHALTTDFKNIYNLKIQSKKMIVELLGCGINPEKSHIFIQSHIPETSELNLYLSMLTTLSRLERIPAYKNEQNNINSYGFLGYPILQAADVLILNANYVPVGEDQLPHLDFIRELTKKINTLCKKKIFNDPLPLLYKYKKIFGFDGTKMSKSQNNTIDIIDISKILQNKINKYITDPNRIYRYQYGNPYNCKIWSLHKIYTHKNKYKYIEEACKKADIGCVDCKKILYDNIEKKNITIIKNIKLYEKKENYINEIIEKNTISTRKIAKNRLDLFKKTYNLL